MNIAIFPQLYEQYCQDQFVFRVLMCDLWHVTEDQTNGFE